MLVEDWPFCPVCLREITEQDKVDISQTLTHILNEEADNYETLLCGEVENICGIGNISSRIWRKLEQTGA